MVNQFEKKINGMMYKCVLILFVGMIQSQTMVKITDFGAKGDSTTLNTLAIQKAIDAVNEAGGGTVVVPSGVFKTGTLQIKSNVTLEVNGKILGTEDTSSLNYPQIDPGYESFCTRPDLYPKKVLLYAKEANNVALTGMGTIDGNGMHNNLRLGDDLDKRMKAINGIRFIRCKNVTIKGKSAKEMLTVTNTGHWAVNPMNCDSVHIQYLKVKEYGGITPDGLPITDSRNVLVEDSYISSDDEACTLKSGSPHITVRDITLKRCILESGVASNKFGSPQSFGPFKNIKIIGCTYQRVPGNIGITYKGYSEGFLFGVVNGGGSMDSVLVEDGIIDGYKSPFSLYIGNIQSGYWAEWWNGRSAPKTYGTMKNITIRNVSYKNPDNYGVLIEGRSGSEIENLVMENVYLPSSGNGPNKDIPSEQTSSYPTSTRIYGHVPAYGFFLRNAKGVKMKNVWTWTLASDPRECWIQEKVTEFDQSGLNCGKVPTNYVPAVSFDNIESGASFPTFTPILVKANARDHDGTIAKVELFTGNNLIGQLTAQPTPGLWSSGNILTLTTSGNHDLELRATDNKGGVSSVKVSIKTHAVTGMKTNKNNMYQYVAHKNISRPFAIYDVSGSKLGEVDESGIHLYSRKKTKLFKNK